MCAHERTKLARNRCYACAIGAMRSFIVNKFAYNYKRLSSSSSSSSRKRKEEEETKEEEEEVAVQSYCGTHRDRVPG